MMIHYIYPKYNLALTTGFTHLKIITLILQKFSRFMVLGEVEREKEGIRYLWW